MYMKCVFSVIDSGWLKYYSIDKNHLYPGSQTPIFLVNLTWRAVKGCVTKISSMDPQELIEVAQP